jgi:hypothetical protein
MPPQLALGHGSDETAVTAFSAEVAIDKICYQEESAGVRVHHLFG